MADVLIIDDQDRYAELCRRAMPEHRFRGPARSWRDAATELARARGKVDVVLLDVHFDIPDEDLVGYRDDMGARAVAALKRRQGVEILRALRARHPDLPVILMTSRDELPLEEDAEQLHAEDWTYFLDDEDVDARTLRAQIDAVAGAQREADTEGPVFWGRSHTMRRLRRRLHVLAQGRLPVVLLGPTGTGKSLLAEHVVHARSGRTGAFVAVDLSTLPRELMSAHLFGSVKGAYTGSVADRVGAFEAAHGGTLFLDEIGNLAPDAQKMLLTVLQDGAVTRLGDLRRRRVDVKLVVATNEDLPRRVRAGTFRGDLYMRLNPAASVWLPPLRDRALDLERLLRFCVERAMAQAHLPELLDSYRRTCGLRGDEVVVHTGASVPDAVPGALHLLFPERAMRLLRAHRWPGNLREFAMTVENALLFAVAEASEVAGSARDDVIQVRPRLVRELLQAVPELEAEEPDDAGAAGDDPAAFRVHVEPQSTLNKVSQSMERQVYEAMFAQEDGNFSAMAAILLGDASHARKVQLRFNQLGLKVRDMKTGG